MLEIKWMPLTLTGLLLAAPAFAAEPKEAGKLASEFGVPAAQVTDLRSQGLGWGEIRNALAISAKAGVPVADVLKLRDSKMGWGAIARKYGFTLGAALGKGNAPAQPGVSEGKGKPVVAEAGGRRESSELRREKREVRHEPMTGRREHAGRHGR
ncbi:MAG: hypothetical protein HY926_12760 [Elusimicrobia bacterium]|nr:hypothetical protein [Elusimicrobiota bacterium]